MHMTPNKKRGMLVLWLSLTVGAFAYTYFRAAYKSWSWPLALCLALIWGFIGVYVLRRSCRKSDDTPKLLERDDKVV
jgi:membrane protein implicated in regulation of membrane protease activity